MREQEPIGSAAGELQRALAIAGYRQDEADALLLRYVEQVNSPSRIRVRR